MSKERFEKKAVDRIKEAILIANEIGVHQHKSKGLNLDIAAEHIIEAINLDRAEDMMTTLESLEKGVRLLVSKFDNQDISHLDYRLNTDRIAGDMLKLILETLNPLPEWMREKS